MQSTNEFNHELKWCLIELATFGHLPANTSVHYARNDNCMVTGGVYSSIPGIQTVANIFKGHASSDFLAKFELFCERVKQCAQESLSQGMLTQDIALKRRKFNEIHLINNALESALGGYEDGGGMYGLLATYQEDIIINQLISAISQMKHSLVDIVKQTSCWYLESQSAFGLSNLDPLPYCPEEHFTDEEWEQAIAISKDLKIESPSLVKYYGKFCTPLLYNQAMNLFSDWNLWDEIFESENNAKLFLGALPLKAEYGDRNDAHELQKLGIQAVLSIVEKFENHSLGNFISPIVAAEWDNLGIKQLQLTSPDFQTISYETLQSGVEFIRWNIDNGRSVYVHCKAGRGRSTLVLMGYLIKHQIPFKDSKTSAVQDVVNHVKDRRPQITVEGESSKFDTLINFEKKLRIKK